LSTAVACVQIGCLGKTNVQQAQNKHASKCKEDCWKGCRAADQDKATQGLCTFHMGM
jgi:hypothetical protein